MVQKNSIWYTQEMLFQKPNGTLCQKKIQWVLVEQGLWPFLSLNLKCAKPQCFNCKAQANCKLCVKDIRSNSCKTPKVYTDTINCTTNQKCDKCIQREAQCKCVSKKYCLKCTRAKSKYRDCKDLPSKCEFDCECL